MTQKIVLALVAIGLLVAGYMTFFVDKKMEVMDDETVMMEEEMTTSAGVTVAETVDSVEYFATKDGMALYTFTDDEFNVSNCSDECLVNWPVFYSSELLVADGFGTITREDGALQSLYLEKPLYTYSEDETPTDTKGRGIGGVWLLATFSK